MGGTRSRGPDAGTPAVTRHGQLRHTGPFRVILTFVASSLAVVLVAGISLGAFAIWRLTSNIETVDLVLGEGEEEAAPPALGKFEGGFNILLAGSDECDPPGTCAGEGRDEVLNDVTMLLHVAEDQQSAAAVSFPRDLIVPIPSCPRPASEGGGNFASMSAEQINVSLTYGGLPCTVQTVEQLTDLDIQYAGLIKFQGVIGMSTAVGGVDVCVDGPIRDRRSGLDLPEAGTYPLEGAQALAFLRTRYGVGDGSDLGRISSQQVFLSSLVRKIKDDSTLTDPAKLYGIASAATSNMTLSSSLAPANTMVSMALVLKDIPLEKITFVQYPSGAGSGSLTNRLIPIRSQADELFAKIVADEPFEVSGTGEGSAVIEDPNAPPTPTTTETDAPVDPSASTPAVPGAPEVLEGVKGQTAAENTCSKANN